MNFCRLLYFCLLYHCTSAQVLETADSYYNLAISRPEFAFVMFYSAESPRSKRLQPQFLKASTKFIDSDPPVSFLSVDCLGTGRETCKRNDIYEYPTFKLFRFGEVQDVYAGRQDTSGIVNYVKRNARPFSREIRTLQELDNFLQDGNEAALVGFFEKPSDLKTVFLNVAEKMKNKAKFGHSGSGEVLDKVGMNQGVVLFRPYLMRNKFEEDNVIYPGNASSAAITDFINKNRHGLVGLRNVENVNDFQDPLVVTYYNADYNKNPKGTNYWRNRILKIANQFKNRINFAISPRKEFMHALLPYDVQKIDEDIPIVVATDSNQKSYLMKQPFSVEAFDKFVKRFADGKLTSHDEKLKQKSKSSKSSKSSKRKRSTPVITASPHNFDDVVMNNGKDTLIEFYAPWCPHCQKLAPVYDELGEKLSGEDVDIVKMDADSNQVPSNFEVSQYPTIYWLPKDSKSSPEKYEGSRRLDNLIKFIAQHSSKELKGYDRDGNPKDSRFGRNVDWNGGEKKTSKNGGIEGLLNAKMYRSEL